MSDYAGAAKLARLSYRADIDGLRAVSVCSVMAYHAFPGFAPGGFSGVDVFFVISGFLISSLIMENLRNGTFHLGGFYIRRIRRIFPALLLTLSVCSLLGATLLLADEYAALGRHIAGSAGFVANFLFWSEVGYFDQQAMTKPLLHLWSLSIEEQFYLLWPLLLLAAKGKRTSFALIVTVGLASFTWSILHTTHNPDTAFFSPLTRAWELISGALLAWVFVYASRAKHYFTDHVLLRDVASVGGGVCLGVSFVFLSSESAFPGYQALLPVMGAVLLLSAGEQGVFNRLLLTNPLLLFFGKTSYSLYLWHWMLLSFQRILWSGEPAPPAIILVLVLSVLLAWGTYRWVETPLRFGRYGFIKATGLVVCIVLIGCGGIFIHMQKGMTWRKPQLHAEQFLAKGVDGYHSGYVIEGCGIEDAARKALYANCKQDKRPPLRYALLGDSKAAALYNGLVRSSSEEGRWLFIGGNNKNGAPVPLLGESSDFTHNQQLIDTAIEEISANPAVQTVVLVSAIRAMFNLENGGAQAYDHTYLRHLSGVKDVELRTQAFALTIDRFVRAGKKVVIVTDNPALPRITDCIRRKTGVSLIDTYFTRTNPDCFVSLELFKQQTTVYQDMLMTLRARHPEEVSLFDATPFLCDMEKGVCGPSYEGHPLYSYTDHISDYAAGRIGVALNAYLHELTKP